MKYAENRERGAWGAYSSYDYWGQVPGMNMYDCSAPLLQRSPFPFVAVCIFLTQLLRQGIIPTSCRWEAWPSCPVIPVYHAALLCRSMAPGCHMSHITRHTSHVTRHTSNSSPPQHSLFGGPAGRNVGCRVVATAAAAVAAIKVPVYRCYF